jgi:hypothetical protein
MLKGSNPFDEPGWMASLTAQAFADFAQEHFDHCVLHPGDVLWVPWGYHCALVAQNEDNVSNTVLVPWLNAAMLGEVSRPVASGVLSCIATWASDGSDSAFLKTYKEEILQWVNACNPTGTPIAPLHPPLAQGQAQGEEEAEEGEVPGDGAKAATGSAASGGGAQGNSDDDSEEEEGTQPAKPGVSPQEDETVVD